MKKGEARKAEDGETVEKKPMTRDDVAKMIGTRYAMLLFTSKQKKQKKRMSKKDLVLLSVGVARAMFIMVNAVSDKGKRINLVNLHNAKNDDLIYDVMGIEASYDKNTNTLGKGFVPRCGFED